MDVDVCNVADEVEKVAVAPSFELVAELVSVTSSSTVVYMI